MQGRTEACKVLIAKGNDVNAMAYSGGTSLMFAAGAGHTEAAEVLIAAGADVNAKLEAKPEFLEQVRSACPPLCVGGCCCCCCVFWFVVVFRGAEFLSNQGRDMIVPAC